MESEEKMIEEIKQHLLKHSKMVRVDVNKVFSVTSAARLASEGKDEHIQHKEKVEVLNEIFNL